MKYLRETIFFCVHFVYKFVCLLLPLINLVETLRLTDSGDEYFRFEVLTSFLIASKLSTSLASEFSFVYLHHKLIQLLIYEARFGCQKVKSAFG